MRTEKIFSGTSGALERDSMNTKLASSTAAVASRAIVVTLLQP